MTQPLRALLVASFLLLFAAAAMATNVTVDCNAAQTINGALAGLDNQGPHTISVSGNCHESVPIFQRERVAIFGAPGTTLTPPLATNRAFSINNATNITIDGFAITGGRGVVINGNSTVNLSNLDIQNSGASGLTITENSRVNASVLHISNSTRSGVSLSNDSSLLIDTSTVENNGASGFSVTNARLQIFGGDGTPGTESYIRNNVNNGVGASGGYVEVDDDVRIQNSGASGVLGIHGVSVFVLGAGLIENSGGNGIYIGETSHGEIDGITVRNNGTNPAASAGRDGLHVVDNSDFYIDNGVTVTGNAGNGVLVDYSSLLSTLGANTITNNGGDGVFIHANGTGHWFAPDTITGNAGASISCDTSSIVTGDITGIANVKCNNVEKTKTNGPKPAGTKGHIVP
jgi:hypothetical protein